MSELQFCIGCGALIPFKYDEPRTWCSEKCKKDYKDKLLEELKEYLADGSKTENEIKEHLKNYNPNFVSEYLQELTNEGVLRATKDGEDTVYRLTKKSSPDPLPCCELNPELQKLLRKRPIKHFSAYTMQNFINYLSEQDATKKQISKWLRKSHTTVENILRYLRRLGLIKSDRKHGKKLCYSLTENGSKLKS